MCSSKEKVESGEIRYHLKGQFSLSPVELFISLDSFDVSCLVLEISTVEISAFSVNGALLVVKNSTVMSLSKNHDPVTQDNPQSWL